MARILIVDDEETVRFALREVLAAHGHAVDEAADGEVGLAKALGKGCDLVVADLIMPRREGIGMIQEIKRRLPDLPVLVISGGARTRGRDPLLDATAAGADAALRKPFSCSELLAAIERLLKRHEVP